MVSYLDQSGVQHLVDKMLDRMYPVNSIYISTNSTSPASLYGGSWERYGTGRALISASDTDSDFTAGTTGGSKTHTITQQELPPHIHDLFAYASGDTNMSTANFVMNQWAYPGQYLQNGKWYPRFAHTVGKDYAGMIEYPNNPISIEQPYVAVYVWRRTA